MGWRERSDRRGGLELDRVRGKPIPFHNVSGSQER